MKKSSYVIATCIALAPTAALAEGLTIPNSASVHFALTGNRVYLRNLDVIDATWLGCCYNYYIDLTTESGKAMFALFLTRHGAARPVSLYVTSKSAGGEVIQMGDW